MLDANVGAYETWANASFAQLSSSPTFVGNVTAPYFLGNGYFLTGIVAGSTYSNANVAAYLPTYTGTLNNSSTIIGIQGNLGAYQVWANGYFASGSSLQTLDANVGAYEIWANGRITTLDANLGTATNNINSINANVTAANAQIQTISANLGAFQTYTNSQFQTFSANSGAFQTYTNSQFQTFSANSGAFQTYANSTFYKSGSSITVANVVTTAGVFWSNGVAYSTGSTYGNTQVAAFLPIYGGNISAANMYATSANITGLVSFGSSYKETVTALGNQTGTLTINVAAGTIQTMTLTGNVTMNTNNLTNFGPGQSVTLIMTQDGSGSRLLTSNLLYAGNVKTLSTTASATDTVNVLYDGSKYLAVIVKGYI